MKEATSETSTSIAVIICVAILIAIFSYMIWPIIKKNFDDQISCDKAVCSNIADSNGMVKCKNPKTGTEILCPNKG